MKKAVTFLLLISSFSIYAQDTVKVSLQELRQKPLDQNLQLILAQKEIAHGSGVIKNKGNAFAKYYGFLYDDEYQQSFEHF